MKELAPYYEAPARVGGCPPLPRTPHQGAFGKTNLGVFPTLNGSRAVLIEGAVNTLSPHPFDAINPSEGSRQNTG